MEKTLLFWFAIVFLVGGAVLGAVKISAYETSAEDAGVVQVSLLSSSPQNGSPILRGTSDYPFLRVRLSSIRGTHVLKSIKLRSDLRVPAIFFAYDSVGSLGSVYVGRGSSRPLVFSRDLRIGPDAPQEIALVLSEVPKGLDDVSVEVFDFEFDRAESQVVGLPLSIFRPVRDSLPPSPAGEKAYGKIRFFVHPDFIQRIGLEELGSRLRGYVDDANAIFRKNTVREYVFDSATDVRVFSADPITRCFQLEEEYETFVYIKPADPRYSGFSGGGNRICLGALYNAEGVAGLRWRDIYTRDEISKNVEIAEDYYRNQFSALVHELGHTHGVALGEYYSIGYRNPEHDNTGVLPVASYKLLRVVPGGFGFNQDDPYWGSRWRVFFDPMLRVSTNPYDVLREMEFSSLSAAIINSEARRRYDSAWNIPPNVPAGDNWITVEARDRQGVPLEACDVWAFSVWPGRDAKIVAKSITDQNGMFLFEWGGVALKGNSLNGGDEKQRLVKVHCDGFMPQAQWLTVFDLQAARYVSGGGAEGDFHYSGKLSFVMPDVVDGGVLSLPVVSFQGDMDGNECVNIVDLVTIARKFGQQVEAGAKEDVSGDGVVNIIDLVTVARDFGKGACRAAYVPPHTSGSIGFASVLKSIFWVIGD